MKSSRTQYVVLALAYALSIASLVWALHDLELRRLGTDVLGLNPLWIGLAVVCMLSTYLVEGVRWSLILAPVGKLRVRQAARAIFVGLFFSEVFPFRAGEIVRCYLVASWTRLPFSVTIASALIERMFDALVMWAGLRFALRNTHIPRSEQLAVDSLGVFVLLGMIVLGIALFRPKLKHARMPQAGWRRRWFILQEDLALIGHSGYLWAALGTTIPYMLLQAVPVYILFREYNFKLSFETAIALMMLTRLAAALPQAPATLGLFQVVTREFLVLGFGILSKDAASFSLVLWGLMKIPLLIAGAIAVAITGTKVGELTKAAQEAHQSNS